MKNKTKEKPLHSGHRSRLREKVRKAGLETLSEHEVIELLLSYSIPRKDTNPLAHNLINNFGSLAKVIDADYYDLLKVEGVGEETALYFNVMSSLIKLHKISKSKEENIIIKNTLDGVNYFRNSFNIEGKEFVHIICLSKMCKIVSSFNFYGENDAEIKFDFKTFIDKINTENVYAIMMFHTHPKGSSKPSYEDLETTQRCVYIASLLGIKFLDHLIFTENEYSSMYQLGYLDIMKNNSAKLVVSCDVSNDLFDVKKTLKNGLTNIDLGSVDFGDISIEDKIKNRRK